MNKQEVVFRLLVSSSKAVLTTGGSITLRILGRDLHLLPSEANVLAERNPDVDVCPPYLVALYELCDGGLESERVLLGDIEQVTVRFAK